MGFRRILQKAYLEVRDFIFEIFHTLKKDKLRIAVLLSICLSSYFYYKYLKSQKEAYCVTQELRFTKDKNGKVYYKLVLPKTEDEHYYHIFLEFLGAIVTFIIVEHSLRRLQSGIMDPKPMPLEKFLKNLPNAKNKVIIYDIFLETVLLDKGEIFYTLFRQGLIRLVDTHKDIKIDILLLSQQANDEITKRANDRNDISPEEYKKRMKRADTKLMDIKREIEEKGDSYKNKLEIRYHHQKPNFAMYCIDENAYISFYPKNLKSTETRQLYTPNDTELGKSLFGFFHEIYLSIWNSNPIDIVSIEE